MRTSETLNEIAEALAKAQETIGHAARSRENPFFKSHYADLAAVKGACQPQLSANGIAVIHAPATNEDGSVTVTTRFLHKSGQWIETDMSAKAVADSRGNVTVQALGSVVTYLKRYLLSAMANVATEDDDGESAAGRSKSTDDKVTVAGKPMEQAKQPDDLDIAAAGIVVDAEFWDRPNYGIAPESGWKIGDWLSHLRAHIEQAPNDTALNQLWNDNRPKIEALSEQRQWWCNEVFSARLSAVGLTAAG